MPASGGGQGLLADLDLELQAVVGMVDPAPAQAQVLARRKLGQVADHRRQAVPAQAWDCSARLSGRRRSTL